MCSAAPRVGVGAKAAWSQSSESLRELPAPRPSGDECEDAEALADTTSPGAGEKPRRPARRAPPSPLPFASRARLRSTASLRASAEAPPAGEAAPLPLRLRPETCAAASASSVRWRRSALIAAAGSVSGSATRHSERRRARCSDGEAADEVGASAVGECAEAEAADAGRDAEPTLQRRAEAGAGAADVAGESVALASPSASPVLMRSCEAS